MKIPLVDLKAQYDEYKSEIDEAIRRVINNTAFILGPEVGTFEDDFASYCEAKFAIGISSGTDALHLALKALEVGPEDEIITTSFTFIATAEAVSMCGARPVFVDIDPQTYNIDVDQVESVITSRTKAIIPVHLYGQPADLDSIVAIARNHQLYVIEDAAQAHGARYKGKRVGAIADAACFSFYPGKNLGAFGDGGMIVTDSKEISGKVRILRDHGRLDKYEHLVVGFGNRLDALQAAILGAKLCHLDNWNLRRREIASRYTELLKGKGIVLPFVSEWAEPVWHQYVVRVKNRQLIQERLKQNGISTGIHYPIPLHLQPAYRSLGYSKGDFPKAEEAAENVLSLPIYPEMTEDHQNIVVDVLSNVLHGV